MRTAERTPRRRTSRRCLAALALLALPLALAVSPVTAANTPDSTIPLVEQVEASAQELERLRTLIAEQRSRLTELRDREEATRLEADNLAREVGLVKTLLAGLATREEILRRQGDSLQVSLAAHRGHLAERQQGLARRMRSLYKRGGESRWQRVLTARSFSELITLLRFETLVARLDTRLVNETRERAERISREQGHLQAAMTGLWEASEEARQERARLEQIESERRALLLALERESVTAQSDLIRLRDRERQLSDLLADLERQREQQRTAGTAGPAGGFEALAGALDWPVRGELVRPFGRSVHPDYGTVTVNNGINIATTAGTPVFAVAAGDVVFADDLPGFGLCVILDHGGGYYSLYANLGRVFASRGLDVARGEIVAEVAVTADEVTAELYFEIRRGKTPLDPSVWLQPQP